MLVICFALALTALTVFFDDWIANQNNPNTDPEALSWQMAHYKSCCSETGRVIMCQQALSTANPSPSC